MAYIPRLKDEYKNRVISALKEEFGYKNVMQVPKLEKIVISRGVGAAVSDKKLVDYAVEELTKTSLTINSSTWRIPLMMRSFGIGNGFNDCVSPVFLKMEFNNIRK